MKEGAYKSIAGQTERADDMIKFKKNANLMREQCRTIEKTLADFRINAKIIGMKSGVNYNRYEVIPAPGVRISSITELKDDIALRLSAPIRYIGLLPGEAAVFIDVANCSDDNHANDGTNVVSAVLQENAIKILNEAERSFDYTIVDLNKSLERLFDALEVLAEKRCKGTSEN